MVRIRRQMVQRQPSECVIWFPRGVSGSIAATRGTKLNNISMSLATSEVPKGSGHETAIDILIAPTDAFEALHAFPTWGRALIAALVLIVIGYFLAQPAAEHASLGTLT